MVTGGEMSSLDMEDEERLNSHLRCTAAEPLTYDRKQLKDTVATRRQNMGDF